MGLILSLVGSPLRGPSWASAAAGQAPPGLGVGLTSSVFKGSPGASVCPEGQPPPGLGSVGLTSATFAGSAGAWVSPVGQAAPGAGLGPDGAQGAPPPGTKAVSAKAL